MVLQRKGLYLMWCLASASHCLERAVPVQLEAIKLSTPQPAEHRQGSDAHAEGLGLGPGTHPIKAVSHQL